MKIGVVCPIGHLGKCGYQYVYHDCICSQAAFADKLYLVDSVRNNVESSGLFEEHRNIEYISDESTWFDLDDQGKELFAIRRVIENVNTGLDVGIGDGMDCVVLLSVNWYVPEPEVLAKRCYRMLQGSTDWDWLYRKDQLAGTMFHASTRLPYIVSSTALHRWEPDSLRLQSGRRIPWKHADWRAYDEGAVVDVPSEMPLSDLNAKLDYLGHGKNHGIDYSVKRFQKEKHPSGEALSPTGLSIAANNQPEFVSNEILRGLQYGE